MGLRVQANSGATAFQKGDLKDEHILVECKTLVKPQKQRTIEKEWKYKSRSASWTPEMRERARQRALLQHGG